jgi:hypothetical protein
LSTIPKTPNTNPWPQPNRAFSLPSYKAQVKKAYFSLVFLTHFTANSKSHAGLAATKPLIINHLPLLISSLTHNKMILSWYPMFNVKWSMIDVK